LPAHLPQPPVRDGDTLLLTSYHLLPGFRGRSGAALLADAKAAGARIALDIGPALGDVAGVAELAELLQHVDFLLANTYELALCTGEDELDRGTAALFAAGAGTIVVKSGGAGASLCTADAHTDVPGFAVPVRSTVGAGDAFAAGFLYALDMGAAPQDAVRAANAVAALVVGGSAGILSAPSWEGVQGFLGGA
jgi:sugar/nucleoside kinase (ribokinase family)